MFLQGSQQQAQDKYAHAFYLLEGDCNSFILNHFWIDGKTDYFSLRPKAVRLTPFSPEGCPLHVHMAVMGLPRERRSTLPSTKGGPGVANITPVD